MAGSKKNTKVTPGKRRSVQPSAPEVKLTYAAAGRDTMAAIQQDLAAPRSTGAEAPLIEISEAPAGRETMAAIAEELAESMRPSQNRRPHADPIPDTPSAPSPSRPAPEASPPRLAPDVLEVFELLTFIIRGTGVGDLSTDALRRRFVEEHLLHRIPSGSMLDVERIEVTPWTAKGTMVVRIWSRA